MKLVKTKLVKEHLRNKKINISSDYMEKLDEITLDIISKSVIRAKGNNRKTVSAKDL